MKKNFLGLSQLTIISMVYGSFLVALPSHASSPLNPGSLDLVSSLWRSAGSAPEDLVEVDGALYFTAHTEAHGRELYSYKNGELNLHELTPGTGSTPFEDFRAIEGGVAFTIDADFDMHDDYIGGVFRDGKVDWIPRDRVDGSPKDDYLIQAGDLFFMYNTYNRVDQLVEIRLEAAVGDMDRYFELDIEVAGYTYSNQSQATFQQAFTANWDELNAIHTLYSLGDYVIMRANVTSAIDNGLYFLDTRNDRSLWHWESLVENYPLKDQNGASVSAGVDSVIIDGNEAYVFFESLKHIQKFGLDANGDLQQLEVVSGALQWEWALDEFERFTVRGGEVFLESFGARELHLLQADGSLLEAPDPTNGFNHLDAAAKLDGVLYLSTRDQLVAWDLDRNILYPAFQSLSLFSKPGIASVAVVGKQVFFTADSLYGIELMVLDTLTDQVSVIDVETAPAITHISDVESFENTLYFYESAVGATDIQTAYLMRVSNGVVSPVMDQNGNLLRTSVDPENFMFPNLIDAVDGTLYFLADENSIADPRLGFYRNGDVTLWALESGSQTPHRVDRPGSFSSAGNLASLLVNEVSQPRLFVALEDHWGVEEYSLFALDTSVQLPQTPTFSAIATHGTNFYRDASNEVFVMQGSIYALTGYGDLPISSSKIAHINIDNRSANILPVSDRIGSNYNSSQLQDLSFLKIVEAQANGASTFFAHVYGERQSESSTVALLDLSPSNPGANMEGLVTMTHKVTDSLLHRSQIMDLHLVPEGPNSESILVVQYDDDWNSGIAYFSSSAVAGFQSAVALPDNNVNLLSNGGTELETSQYFHSVFDAGSNLLFVPAYHGDGDLSYQLFRGSDLASSVTLSNVAGMWSGPGTGGFISGDTFLRLESNTPIANLNGALYFPVMHKSGRYGLFKFDPSSQTSRYNSTIPISSGSLESDLGIKFPLRPVGTNANVSLKSNFPGGPADVILRGAGSVSLNPAAFVRPGFALVGWSETSNGQVDYAADANFGFRSSVKLYAVWEQSLTVVTVPTPVQVPVPVPVIATGQAKISFITPESLQEPDDQVAKSGEVLILPELERPGYEFDGWSETATGPIFAGAYRPVGNVELHARFSPLTVKVFFAPQVGVKLPTSITYTSGTELVLPDPKKPNFTFTGWVNQETGERLPRGWLPTEATLLAPMFKAGSPDHQVRFWNNSSHLSKFQLGRLGEFASNFASLRGTKSLLITGYDHRNSELARKRALNTAIKLRKLGIKVAIELRVVTESSSRPTTQIVVLD